jgi:hypothetical protein
MRHQLTTLEGTGVGADCRKPATAGSATLFVWHHLATRRCRRGAGAVGERPVRWRMGLIDKLIRFMHYDLGAPAIEVGHHRLAAEAGSTLDPSPR